MDHLLQDIRFAVRSLIKSPMLALASVASLALGIGSSSAVFSAIDVFMFRPLEFEDSDDLVLVSSTNEARGSTFGTSADDFRDWRATARTVELAAYTGAGFNLTTTDGAIRLDGLAVSSAFFDILRVAPQLGRSFGPHDERFGGGRVAILGSEVWQQTFGGDPTVVGRVFSLDGEPTEVVGIMPDDFQFGQRQDAWIPLRFSGEERRAERFLTVLGRIAAASSLDAVQSELGLIAARIANEFPDSNADVGVEVRTVQDEWFDEGFREGTLIGGAAVFFVLLISCANVANLLLARGADREREIALRAAIGAGRGRLISQLLTESLILALIGGIVGLGIGYIGMEGIKGIFPPGVPGAHRLVLDGRMLAFTAGVTALAGVLFGLAPALQTSMTNLRDSLGAGNRAGASRRGGRIRSGLVMAEMGLSVVLLISAVLLVKAFAQIRANEVGFDLDEVASMQLSLSQVKYPGPEDLRAFNQTVLDRVAGLPGVEFVAAANLRPMQGNTSAIYTVEGEDPPDPGREPSVNVRYVSPDYFNVMGIELSRGRAITEADQHDTAPVVVVNETFAARHWDGRSPLGERVHIWEMDSEIVGVVPDTRDSGPDSPPGVMVYAPLTQRTWRNPMLMVRTEQEIATIATSVREAVREIDPEQAVYDFRTLREVLDERLSGNVAMAKVLAVLALIAFVLSAVGVYGVMAYSVACRTQEMGIRQSLGADSRDVRILVVRQGLTMAGIGIVGGLILSSAATRLLAFFLFGVSPFDPVAFGGVPLALLLTALAASWLPAVRATRVDPVVALRNE